MTVHRIPAVPMKFKEGKKATPQPQNCPKCGASAEVKNPKPRNWFVAYSRNSSLASGHRVMGHGMFTRRDAIIEWNKLR